MTDARDADAQLAALEAEYRRSRYTIIKHAIFLVLCCTAAVLARKFFKMPPALLTVAFVVALLLFGGDFVRFLGCRRRLRRLREAL